MFLVRFTVGMWTALIINISAAIGLSMLTHVSAFGFDCAQAHNRSEQLICKDIQLVKLDKQLNVAYARLQKQIHSAAKLQMQQTRWLTNVRNSCQSSECLKQAYEARTSQLTLAHFLPNRRIKYKSEDLENCQTVADFSNLGALRSLSVHYIGVRKQAEDARAIFGNSVDPFGTFEYLAADLNGDGVPDHFAVTTQGTAHVSSALVRSGKDDSFVSEINADRNILDLSVLAVNGKYYFLSHLDDFLMALFRVDDSGSFEKVCTFSVRKDPLVELKKGVGRSLCTRISQGSINYLSFNFTHAILELPPEERFKLQHPMDGMAKVDINNDGKPDNLLRVRYAFGGGRTCEREYLATANEVATTIPDTALNKLLLHDLGGHCGPNLNAFEIGGSAYVEADHSNGTRTIYRIKGEQLQEICEFRGRRLHDVVNAD